MASQHKEFLAAGTRLYAISVDNPERNAAMVDKLSLPFPYLSDPDRSEAIDPFGVADPKDERQISRPAMIVLTPEGEETFRFVSRDFADRLAEAEVLAAIGGMGLAPTTQDLPARGPAEPGPRSLSPSSLRIYFRGARFAALAMGLRHGHHAEEIKQDSKAYVSEMDRFTDALDWLRQHTSSDESE